MSSHMYDSPEYYAQQFVNFIRGDKRMFKKYGWALGNAEHHKNTVSFEIDNVKHRVIFGNRGERMFVSLDLVLVNHESILGECQIEKTMDVERSKTGRISGNYFPRFFDKFIMMNFRNFYARCGEAKL